MALVCFDNVTVQLPIYSEQDFSIRRRVVRSLIRKGEAINPNSVVTALKNVSVEFKDGDKVGLVGLNGAGKTTFLKVVAGIYPCSSGAIQTSGRCSTIFDLNLGMDEEASGYENLFIAGHMLGMGRVQVSRIIPDIEEFTELGKALHRPIRTYSSGMRVRLAFGVATSFGRDIMLIDEIIGVGDARFLKKASQRIRTRMEESKIVVLASHADFVLKDFCDKGILLHEGKVIAMGKIGEVIEEYNENIVRPYWATLSQ